MNNLDPEKSLLTAVELAKFGKYTVLAILVVTILVSIYKKRKSQPIKSSIILGAIAILLTLLVFGIGSWLFILPAYNLK